MFPTLSFLKGNLYDLLNVYGVMMLFYFNLDQMYHQQPPLSRNLAWLRSKVSAAPKLQKTVLPNYWVWTVVESLLFSCAQQVGCLFNWQVGELVGTGANYFSHLFLFPIPFLAMSFLLWTDPLKKADLIAPAFAMTLIIAKVACFCSGCCSGFQCSWGMFNQSTNQREFPIQLVEAAVALGLFLVLLKLRGKVRPGTMFPIYVLLYSGIRFFTEFARYEENVFWIFKIYHFCCLAGLAYGFILLALVRKFGPRISAYFETRMSSAAAEEI